MKEIISIPNASKTFQALRSLGYDVNSSIADLIDNSITDRIGANNVNVIFHHNDDFEVVVRVKDNGIGMSSDELEEAMRIGAEADYKPGDLGKFGMGMKTASLSHCNKLTVISKKEGLKIAGYQWDLGHVKKSESWSLLKLEEEEIDMILKAEGFDLNEHGTIVLWDDLFLINNEYNSIDNDKIAQNYLFRKVDSLKLHLRMVFHRFLDPGFNVTKNFNLKVNMGSLLPWDPFCKDEEATYKVGLTNEETNLYLNKHSIPVEIIAYILPTKEGFSSEKKWKEAKGLLSWNDSQGYYIYRANRLIRFGGWHGTKAKDEHDKLARISIDIDPAMDQEFRITVNKNRVEFPEQLFQHLKNIVNPKVINKAKSRYRKEPEKNLVKNTIRTSSKLEKVSKTLLSENKIISKQNDNSEVAEIEVNNPTGTWLSNKIKDFLKYGDKKDFEIVSDHIEGGQLWKIVCDPNNRFKVIINSSHPFYSLVYKPNANKETTDALDALFFSLAFGELYNRNEGNAHLFETFKVICSKALEKVVTEKVF